MPSVHQPPSFVEFAFGAEFAASLAARDAAPVLDDEYRPSASFGHATTAWEAAWWSGFTLGLDREDAAAPDGLTSREIRAFDAGWTAGFRLWERRLDEMYADAVDRDGGLTDLDVHPRGVC